MTNIESQCLIVLVLLIIDLGIFYILAIKFFNGLKNQFITIR
jgi:hypothetical protein